ncbi:MAG: putative amino acid permease, GabP family [Cytophagales bacterium]|jgi:APA family basic amino acid/polyamine antiporter|nr:amino acid permease [Bacteroidota bacterium]MBS1979754.1 amino acid permease [Bacteroidota bacterium]WHZ07009.1 MAG: putative amino acid permease, GabP family [Cytophagales bacterium]
MSLFIKKPLNQLLAQATDSETGLKRTLGAGNLIALGIGAIIGAGLFVRTAAAAGEHAGPAVTLSFIFAAIGCAFAGLCYAEFASMIPVAGSAYTYAYVTMGEFVAWIIGWALVLEYALGAATVSIAWSEFLNKLLGGAIPYEWCHSPFQKALIGGEMHHGIMNAPALIVLLALSLLLIKGTQESAIVNSVIVVIKVAIVLVFIWVGWQFIKPENHTPYLIPADAKPALRPDGTTYSYESVWDHGWLGVVAGAGVVFFAFIGFDAISTAAQETKNPKKDMPIGILGSLVICTILYILFSYVLTGVAPYTDFMLKGKEASVAYAIEEYMVGYGWLANLVSIAILAGFSSVILVMLMGQSRVFYSMSVDGLLPKVFAELHPKFRTPYKSNLLLFVFVGLIATLLPGDITGDLTSIGTLFAFVLVCVGILVMRKSNPDVPRGFKTPWVPFVPIMGILVCSTMIIGLDSITQLVAGIWLVIGLVVYFFYSQKNSQLRKKT